MTANYDDTVKLRIYNQVIKRKDKDPSITPNITGKAHKKTKETRTDISQRSLSRTRKNIINTVQNNLDVLLTFITLTFKENLNDVDEAILRFQKYIRKLRTRLKKDGEELYYIAIPEFQKRGAIHFHMLCNIKVGSELIPKQPPKKVNNDGVVKEIYYYDLPYWDYGYSLAYEVVNNAGFNLGLYISKYMQKDLNNDKESLFCGRQKVFKSQNLKKPIVEYINDSDYLNQIQEDLSDCLISKYLNIKRGEYDRDFVEYEYDLS